MSVFTDMPKPLILIMCWFVAVLMGIFVVHTMQICYGAADSSVMTITKVELDKHDAIVAKTAIAQHVKSHHKMLDEHRHQIDREEAEFLKSWQPKKKSIGAT